MPFLRAWLCAAASTDCLCACRLQAFDDFMTAAACSFTLTVNDEEKPQIEQSSCPTAVVGTKGLPPWPEVAAVDNSGDEVDIKLKTRGLLHMGAIAEVLQQSHVSFEVQGPEDLSAEVVANKLQQCGGAHKPNAYDFGGGEVLQLEYYTKPA